jgi:hypothetical protein
MGCGGNPNTDVVEKVIKIYDSSFGFWVDHDPVAQKALGKLTKEELIALGIKL